MKKLSLLLTTIFIGGKSFCAEHNNNTNEDEQQLKMAMLESIKDNEKTNKRIRINEVLEEREKNQQQATQDNNDLEQINHIECYGAKPLEEILACYYEQAKAAVVSLDLELLKRTIDESPKEFDSNSPISGIIWNVYI